MDNDVSRRGVYYNLEKSPFGFIAPGGDVFKFRSKKQLDMYTRDVAKEYEKLDQLFEKYDIKSLIPTIVSNRIKAELCRKVYRTYKAKYE